MRGKVRGQADSHSVRPYALTSSLLSASIQVMQVTALSSAFEAWTILVTGSSRAEVGHQQLASLDEGGSNLVPPQLVHHRAAGSIGRKACE